MVVKIDPVCQLLLLEKRNYTHSNVCAVQLCRSMHIHAFYTQLQKFGKKKKVPIENCIASMPLISL